MVGAGNETIERRARLLPHMTTDTKTGLETCKFCQKTFNRQSNLMDHIDNVHLKVQSYECQFCGMKYSGKSQLSVHIKRKHTEEKYADPVTSTAKKMVAIDNPLNDYSSNTNVKVETFDMDESTGNLFEVNSDPLNVELSKTNPWSVQDVSAFLKYCCPDCDYIDENLRLFATHAICNHSNAETFFTTQKMLEIKSESEVQNGHWLLENNFCSATENGISDVKVESQEIEDGVGFDDKKMTKFQYKRQFECGDCHKDYKNLDTLRQHKKIKKHMEYSGWEYPKDSDSVAKIDKETKVPVNPEPNESNDLKKPKMSYAELIKESLMKNPDVKLTSTDIYKKISASYPYYKMENKDWKNHIRHCLTIYDIFTKLSQDKGSFWTLTENLTESDLELIEQSKNRENERGLNKFSNFYPLLVTEVGSKDSLNACVVKQELLEIINTEEGQKSIGFCDFKHEEKEALKTEFCTNQTIEIGQKPTYDQDALFSCNICQISFLQRKYYRRHIILTNQDGKKLFKCCACDKKFTFPDGIRSHMRHIELVHDVHIKRQQNSETHICDQCGFSAKSSRSLKLHNRQKHNSENLSESDGLPKTNKKKCLHCDYEAKNLNWHIDRKHPEHGEKNFCCDKCEECFIFKSSFAYHVKNNCKTSKGCEIIQAKRKEKNKLVCTKCGKVYSSTTDLKRHMNSFHLKLKPSKCTDCPAAFTRENSLQYHIKTLHENNYEKHPCLQCDKVFKLNDSLKHHVLSVHEKQFDFKCEFCGKDFTTQETLSTHISRIHKQKEMHCEICDKKFTGIIMFRFHKLDVHKEKIEHWICNECPSQNWKQRFNCTFFSEAGLHRHNEIKH